MALTATDAGRGTGVVKATRVEPSNLAAFLAREARRSWDRPVVLVYWVGRLAMRTREITLQLASSSQRATAVRHRLSVVVVPAHSVGGPDGGVGFGAFCGHDTLTHGPTIWLAGKVDDRFGRSRRDAEEFLRSTFAHELAHYEQFRDGRPVQERGVAVRTRTLARSLEAR